MTKPEMPDNFLNIPEHAFTEIPCDKCGTVSAYTNPEEVTECFGCKCKRLHEMKIICECGWTGSYFEQRPCHVNLGKYFCPDCGKEGYTE